MHIEEDEDDEEAHQKKRKKRHLSSKLSNEDPLSVRISEFFTSALDYIRFSDLYYLGFLIMSILGMVYSGYTYCFHTLHIVAGNDLLVRVLQSVTINGASLLWVAALGVVIIYIYSVAGFAFYRDTYAPGGYFCTTLWECFISTLASGLFNGINSFAVTNQTWESVGLKVIYDLSFYIIISTIGLNIVFGIIVDSFSELRDDRYHIVEDMQGVCSICGLPSDEFERNSTGFRHHVKKEHNMWAYILYCLYLSEKDRTEYSAFEAYVADLIAKEDHSWFPVNRSLALSENEEDPEQSNEARIIKTLDLLVSMFQETEVRRREEVRQNTVQKWKEEAKEEAEKEGGKKEEKGKEKDEE